MEVIIGTVTGLTGLESEMVSIISADGRCSAVFYQSTLTIHAAVLILMPSPRPKDHVKVTGRIALKIDDLITSILRENRQYI